MVLFQQLCPALGRQLVALLEIGAEVNHARGKGLRKLQLAELQIMDGNEHDNPGSQPIRFVAQKNLTGHSGQFGGTQEST